MQQGQSEFFLFADAEPTRQGETVAGFAGVAYSGGVVPNFGFSGDMAVDLSSLSMPPTSKIPVTLNHDDDQIVGYAAVVNDGNSLHITEGRFSAVTEEGKRVAGLMAEGQPFMYSIGIKGRGRSASRARPSKLNGRELPVDTILHDSRLLHISFVPAGADPHAYAARLSARNGLTPPSATGDPSMDNDRITELEQQVKTLTAERNEAREERDAARTELTNLAATARNKAIVDLFGKDNDLTEAQLAAYRGMTAEQFDAVSTHLMAARADPSLFTQTATAGANHLSAAPAAKMKVPAGYSVDPASADLDAKVLKFQAEHPGTDYVAALCAVQQGA